MLDYTGKLIRTTSLKSAPLKRLTLSAAAINNRSKKRRRVRRVSSAFLKEPRSAVRRYLVLGQLSLVISSRLRQFCDRFAVRQDRHRTTAAVEERVILVDPQESVNRRQQIVRV